MNWWHKILCNWLGHAWRPMTPEELKEEYKLYKATGWVRVACCKRCGVKG